MPDQQKPLVYSLDLEARQRYLYRALRLVTAAFIAAEATMAFLAWKEGANGAAITALSVGVIGATYAVYCEYNLRKQDLIIEQHISKMERFVKYIRVKEELEKLKDDLELPRSA